MWPVFDQISVLSDSKITTILSGTKLLETLSDTGARCYPNITIKRNNKHSQLLKVEVVFLFFFACLHFIFFLFFILFIYFF